MQVFWNRDEDGIPAAEIYPLRQGEKRRQQCRVLRARDHYARPGPSDTHGWGVKSPNRSLLICFEEVGLEQHCLSLCGGERVQETQVPSSPWSAVAAG